jgi:DNA-directed RNA polymerase subunit RPC12/RpoP
MMKELKFICPDCGHDKLEEVERGSATTELVAITIDTEDPMNPDIDHDMPNYDGLVVECYGCANCGRKLSDGSMSDLVVQLLALDCNAGVESLVSNNVRTRHHDT